MQLERILHCQGFGSRKEVRRLIRAGWVEIAGEVCDDPFADFATENLSFTVDDETWQYQEQAYLMLHKPAAYETSHKPIHHPSVFSLLPEPLRTRGVQAVGRLDQDTTGLLLFTDDGQFIHRLSSPKRQIAKTYVVTTKHEITPEQMANLQSGVLLHDETEPLAAHECSLLAPNRLRLAITGGKYHQVKRMVAAAGNRVEQLERVAIGNLHLPHDLAPGTWRWLSAAEVQAAQTGIASL